MSLCPCPVRFLLLLFVCILRQTESAAQAETPSATVYKLTGRIFDSASLQPLEFATIALAEQVSGKMITGGLSNIKGAFTLSVPAPGIYTLTAEAIGYQKRTVTDISIPEGSRDNKLPDILLSRKAVLLQNVVVNSTKMIIENKIDKLVYNVDKDITSQGGTTSEVLRKIPGVSVDIDGNVELLGNPSIRFLIDGKPSGIFGNSVADALQSIPASQIQSIEVITSPGAKYDASGTGGIINIILKKNKLEGFNGNISIAAGTRLENGNINAGWKKNKVALNAYFGGNAQLNAVTPLTLDRISFPGNGPVTSRLLQHSDASAYRNGYKSGMGLEWSLSKTATISVTLGYNHMKSRSKGNTDQFFTAYDGSGNLQSQQSSIRFADSKFYVNSFENSFNYKKELNDKGRELSLSYDGSFDHNNTFYDQTQRYTVSSPFFGGSQSLNPGIENEMNFALDYTDPLSKKVNLETGLRLTMTDIISNADVLTLDPANGTYKQDAMQSYRSDYHRQVYAGYVSLSFPLSDKTDVKAGIRAEHTENRGNYSNSGKADLPAYDNFAPSFVIAHTFSGTSSLKFAFSYRLERPDYRDLNPFMNLSDPHNISTGNPHLQAEIGHNFELTYLKSFENGVSLSIVANNQKNSPDIKPYTTYYSSYKIGDSLYSDVTVTTRDNIAAEIRRGVNISIAIPAGKKFSTRTNVMVYNRHLKNIHADPVITNAFGLRVNMTTTWQVSRTFIAEAFGNYNLGMRWQGRQATVFSYTLAVRKQLMKNKASLGFITTVPFNKYVNQRSVQEAAGFSSHNFRQVPYRSFGISFTWKFGKLKFKQPKESDNYLYTPPSEN